MLACILMVSLMASAATAQYTCPTYAVGTSLVGTGLGGVNGLYQAKSQDECCYNCFVVNNSTCAGYNYYNNNKQCFLASSISYSQSNAGSGVASGTNPNFKSSGTTDTTKNTATTTTTLAGSSGNGGTTAPTTTTLPTTPAAATRSANCFVSFKSNIIGYDLYQTLATSINDCCNKCANAATTIKCAGFSYQATRQICSLKYINPLDQQYSNILNVNAGLDFSVGNIVA